MNEKLNKETAEESLRRFLYQNDDVLDIRATSYQMPLTVIFEVNTKDGWTDKSERTLKRVVENEVKEGNLSPFKTCKYGFGVKKKETVHVTFTIADYNYNSELGKENSQEFKAFAEIIRKSWTRLLRKIKGYDDSMKVIGFNPWSLSVAFDVKISLSCTKTDLESAIMKALEDGEIPPLKVSKDEYSLRFIKDFYRITLPFEPFEDFEYSNPLNRVESSTFKNLNSYVTPAVEHCLRKLKGFQSVEISDVRAPMTVTFTVNNKDGCTNIEEVVENAVKEGNFSQLLICNVGFSVKKRETFRVTFKIEDYDYTPELENEKGDQFKDLASSICEAWAPLLKKIKGCGKMKIVGFSQGSIIVAFDIEIGLPCTKTDLESEVMRALEEGEIPPFKVTKDGYSLRFIKDYYRLTLTFEGFEYSDSLNQVESSYFKDLNSQVTPAVAHCLGKLEGIQSVEISDISPPLFAKVTFLVNMKNEGNTEKLDAMFKDAIQKGTMAPFEVCSSGYSFAVQKDDAVLPTPLKKQKIAPSVSKEGEVHQSEYPLSAQQDDAVLPTPLTKQKIAPSVSQEGEVYHSEYPLSAQQDVWKSTSQSGPYLKGSEDKKIEIQATHTEECFIRAEGSDGGKTRPKVLVDHTTTPVQTTETLYIELKSYFSLPCCGGHICPATDTTAWVCGGEYPSMYKIRLITSTGTTKREWKIDLEVLGVCVHPTTGQMYICTDYAVRQVNTDNGSTEVMFRFDDYNIRCIAVTQDDKLIIGVFNLNTHRNEICLCRFTGEILYTGITGTRVYHIATHDNKISVACDYGGVMVFDDKLHRMYTYTGDTVQGGSDEMYTYTGGTLQGGPWMRFETHSTAFLDNNTLLVADSNCQIHVVDSMSGKLRQTLKVNGKVDKIAVYQSKWLWMISNERPTVFFMRIGST